MALVSYFTSKKSGNSDTKSALIAAGAGLGTYYVATETKWGQDVVSSMETKWDSLFDNGEPVLNADGSQATAPPGSVVVKTSTGEVARNASGDPIWQLANGTVSTAGKVLSSWGGTGTAAVIGTAAVAGSTDLEKYLPWIIGGFVFLMVAK